MASPEAEAEAEAPRITVEDIFAMSDGTLAQFMKQHLGSDGGYQLPIDGWDKLSKDERESLAERLKNQQRSLGLSPTTGSRPLDLDDLDARLRQTLAESNSSLQSRSRIVDSPQRVTPPFDATQHERRCYHDLVSDGGRPVYHIDVLEEVLTNPEKYIDVLRPWQDHPDNTSAEGMLMRQLFDWEDFRKWQNDNRRVEYEYGFPEYVERRKRWVKQDLPEDRAKTRLAQMDADPSRMKSDWDLMQILQYHKPRLHEERGCNSFRDYINAVKRRLAQHDFAHPFQLYKDPRKQDPLSTWIEYLNYKYWWLDTCISDISRLEPAHDKSWQELVDMKILGPHETTESIREIGSLMRLETIEQNAKEAMQRAKSEAQKIHMLTQEDSRRERIPRSRRMSMLRAGRTKFLAAQRQFEQIRSRHDQITAFIQQTHNYHRAKREAARLRILIQWVLDQVSLIEAEMAKPQATEAAPEQPKRGKKRLRASGETLEDRSHKMPKHNCSTQSTRDPVDAAETRQDPHVVTGPGIPARRSAHSIDDADLVISQGPRRSARIAARQKATQVSDLATETKICKSRSRSRPRGKPPGHSKSQSPAKGAAVSAEGKGMLQTVRHSEVKPMGGPRKRRQRRLNG